MTRARARLTADLCGTGGRLQEIPEDFEVEEVPAYLPSGDGPWLYLWVEKRAVDGAALLRALARALEVPEREVSAAGIKDRQAVTRQWVCVPATAEPRAGALTLPGVRVLASGRHGNRLRTGHLRGNRFRIRIRAPERPACAGPILEALRRLGLPNAFGPQRFGRGGDNAELGRRLLRGERVGARVDRFQRRLLLSAYQSSLFNRALDERLREGLFGRALAGDVLRKADTGGLFVCTAPDEDQARVDRLEVSPTGPMFGWKMPEPDGEPAAREARILESEGLTLAAFRKGGGETEGTRRPFSVPVEELQLEEEADALRLSFFLPRGSYATVLLDELVK